jgi:hypothetical protein
LRIVGTAAGIATIPLSGPAAGLMNSGKVISFSIRVVDFIKTTAATVANTVRTLTVVATERVVITTAPIVSNPDIVDDIFDVGAVIFIDGGVTPTTGAGTAVATVKKYLEGSGE